MHSISSISGRPKVSVVGSREDLASDHTIFTVLSISDRIYVSSQPLPGFLRVCSRAWAISNSSGVASVCSGCSWQNRTSFTSPSIRRTYRRGNTALSPPSTESFSPKSRHTRLRIKTPVGWEGKSQNDHRSSDMSEMRFSSEEYQFLPQGGWGTKKHPNSSYGFAQNTQRQKEKSMASTWTIKKLQPNFLLFCANKWCYHSPYLSFPKNCFEKKVIKNPKRMDYLHRDVIFLTYTVQCFTSQIPWLVKIKVLNQLCSPQYTLYQIKTSGRPWTNGLRAPAFIRTWVGAPAIILCYLSKSLQFTFFISENGPLWRWNNILPRPGHVGRIGLDARVTMLMGTGMATISL